MYGLDVLTVPKLKSFAQFMYSRSCIHVEFNIRIRERESKKN